MRKRKQTALTWGHGILDYEGAKTSNGKPLHFFTLWRNMLRRCYSEKFHLREPSYKGCSVCDDWLHLSKFKEWYDKNYIEGFHLDKDLIHTGNKIYSPEHCVFIPGEVNKFLERYHRGDDRLPTGVIVRKGKPNFIVYIRFNSQNTVLGTFSNPVEAKYVYIRAKERQARILAERYKDRLSEPAYNALINYNANDGSGLSDNELLLFAKQREEDYLKNKKRSSRCRAVRQYDLDGNFIKEYEAISDAVSILGLEGNRHISDCCNGKRSNCGGYIWKYAE